MARESIKKRVIALREHIKNVEGAGQRLEYEDIRQRLDAIVEGNPDMPACVSYRLGELAGCARFDLSALSVDIELFLEWL